MTLNFKPSQTVVIVYTYIYMLIRIFTHIYIKTSLFTVIWNGPMGVFEFEAFAKGTNGIATTLAELTGKVIFIDKGIMYICI